MRVTATVRQDFFDIFGCTGHGGRARALLTARAPLCAACVSRVMTGLDGDAEPSDRRDE